MIEYGICLIALIIGSITDLRTREVPDYLNFILITIGFGMAILASSINKDITYIFTSLIGFAFCFIFSIIMYYSGQWGGGDAKMLMGIGSVIGISYTTLRSFEMPFLLLFLILTFFIGGIYGLVWLSIILIKNWQSFKKIYKITYDESNKYLRYGLYFSIPILIIWALSIEEFYLKVILIVLSIMLIFLYYSFIAIKVLEEIAFIKEQPIEKVTEGDWVAEDIIVNGKTIINKKNLGITKEQLTELNILVKKGKLKTVKIKYGIPFVPSFLLAFIATIIIWLQ
jgi:Flp pilus assembly protein protease CpaA